MGVCGSKKNTVSTVRKDMLGTGYVPKKVENGQYKPEPLQWIVGDGKLLMFNKDSLTIEKVEVINPIT